MRAGCDFGCTGGRAVGHPNARIVAGVDAREHHLVAETVKFEGTCPAVPWLLTGISYVPAAASGHPKRGIATGVVGREHHLVTENGQVLRVQRNRSQLARRYCRGAGGRSVGHPKAAAAGRGAGEQRHVAQDGEVGRVADLPLRAGDNFSRAGGCAVRHPKGGGR